MPTFASFSDVRILFDKAPDVEKDANVGDSNGKDGDRGDIGTVSGEKDDDKADNGTKRKERNNATGPVAMSPERGQCARAMPAGPAKWDERPSVGTWFTYVPHAPWWRESPWRSVIF